MDIIIPPAISAFVPKQCVASYGNEIHATMDTILNTNCFKAALAKALGYAIIAGSVVIQMPQIIKMWRSGSAEGLSFLSFSLALFSSTCSSVYCFLQSFPFSSYGDTVFLGVQLLLICLLMLHYRGQEMQAILLSIFFSIGVAFLLSPMAPPAIITALQSSVLPIVVVSKLIQAFENFRNSSTGQLSLVSVLLMWGGSGARIFTSFQETGDTMLIATFVGSFTCNSILLFQIFYYWSSSKLKSS